MRIFCVKNLIQYVGWGLNKKLVFVKKYNRTLLENDIQFCFSVQNYSFIKFWHNKHNMYTVKENSKLDGLYAEY